MHANHLWKQFMKKSPSIHVDETGISLAGKRGWIWGMRAEEWMIYKSRSSHVVDKYLNGYQGAIVTDRYAVYRRFDDGGKHHLGAFIARYQYITCRILYRSR